jgi:membrane-associated phospholipid phosphatase
MKKVFGHFFSILFVPLLLPLYGTIFILYFNPFNFPDKAENTLTLMRVGILTFFLPSVTILLLVGLKFIKSLNIYDRQERAIPYIAAMFFYIWAFYVYYKENFNPQITFILLGAAISVFLDFIINLLVIKISMHTTGAGGLVAMVMLLSPFTYYNPLYIFMGVIVIAGCIGAARLALKAHSEQEVYFGYISGFFSFMLANIFFTF